MGKVIACANQKGGVGKSTLTAITSYLLAEKGFKVLAIDFDSQGNLTSFLSRRSIYDFNGETILQGIQRNDMKSVMVKVMEYLDLIPSNDFVAGFAKWLYTEYRGIPAFVIRDRMAQVREEYDYILIDTPPSLGEITTGVLACADYVVIPYQTDQMTFDALFPFYETIEFAKQPKINPNLQVVGIIRRILDSRVKETKEYLSAVEEYFPNHVFHTVLTSKASTRRLMKYGFRDNDELNIAVKDYRKYIEELLERCQ